jgi:hypothetical protein
VYHTTQGAVGLASPSADSVGAHLLIPNGVTIQSESDTVMRYISYCHLMPVFFAPRPDPWWESTLMDDFSAALSPISAARERTSRWRELYSQLIGD